MTKEELKMVEGWGKEIYKIACNSVLKSYEPEKDLREVVNNMIDYLEEQGFYDK